MLNDKTKQRNVEQNKLHFPYPVLFCACSIWVSPLFPTLPVPGGDSIGDSVTHFKRDLLQYLSVYRHSRVTEWADIVKSHDLSAAK